MSGFLTPEHPDFNVGHLLNPSGRFFAATRNAHLELRRQDSRGLPWAEVRCRRKLSIGPHRTVSSVAVKAIDVVDGARSRQRRAIG